MVEALKSGAARREGFGRSAIAPFVSF